MGIIDGTIPYVPGVEGSSFFGGRDLMLGPCNAYIGNSTPVALAGTIATDGTTNALTGTGTAFTTALKVGQYVQIASSLVLYRIATITTDTAATVEGIPPVGTGQTAKLVSLMSLGGSDATTVSWKLHKTPLKESQSGDNAADQAVVGFETTIEMGLTRLTLERMERVIQGMNMHRQTADGAIDSAVFVVPLGQTDSSIWDMIHLVRIGADGGESTDVKDHITFFRAVATPDAQQKKDAASQIITKSMFTCYRDDTRKVNGAPAVFMIGTYIFS